MKKKKLTKEQFILLSSIILFVLSFIFTLLFIFILFGNGKSSKTESYAFLIVLDKKETEIISSTPQKRYEIFVTNGVDSIWCYTEKSIYEKYAKDNILYNATIRY